MSKKNQLHPRASFEYGLIARASALALLALAADGARAVATCSVNTDTTVSSTTPSSCTFYDASPNANLTITGTGTVSGGVTTGNNTAGPSSPVGVFSASGGSIIVQSGGIVTNSSGPGINLGRSGSYTTETSIPGANFPPGCVVGVDDSCVPGMPTTVSTPFNPTTTTALSGSISNAGTISGNAYGIRSTITGTGVVGGINNTGLITTLAGSSAGGAGIAIGAGSSITGGITNSGTISAGTGTIAASAIYLSGSTIGGGGYLSGGITNNSGGLITSSNDTVNIAGTLSGNLTNNSGGTISSSASSDASSSAVRVTGTVQGSLVNSGALITSASSEGGYGLRISSGASVTGSITNSGLINGIYLETGSSVGGTITNTGTITAGNSADNKSLLFDSTQAKVFNNNGGTISGGIASLGSATTLNLNSGLISSTMTGSGSTTLNISGTVSSAGTAVGATTRITGPIQFDTSSTATGAININGGFVSENTIQAKTLNINSGGTLYATHDAGFGTAIAVGSGGLNILSGGTLAVVNTSTVSGAISNAGAVSIAAGKVLQSYSNYTQTSSGVLQIDVASGSSYGKLGSFGTITMPTGAKVDVVVASGASLTVGGLLSNVVSNMFGMTTITGGLASTYVVTDNSDLYDFTAETCTGLVETEGCSTGSMGLRIRAGGVLGRTAATRPLVTTGVSGTIFQMLRMGNNVVQAVSSSNSSGGGINTGDVLGDRHGWIKPLAMQSKQADEGTVSGYKADSYGIIGGMDGTYNDKTRLGVAASFMSSKVESNRSLATHDATISSWRVIGYGSYAISADTEATFQGDYSNGTIKGSRTIAPGDVASSKYKNNTWHLSGALSRVINLTPGKTTFTPTVRVDHTHSRDQGYTETGGSSNLVVQSNTSKETIVAVQGKINHALSSTTTLSANLSAGYDVVGQQSSLTAAALGGGSTFVATGMAPQREVYQLGLGSLTKLANGGEVNVRYDVETRRGFTGQSISVKYRKSF